MRALLEGENSEMETLILYLWCAGGPPSVQPVFAPGTYMSGPYTVNVVCPSAPISLASPVLDVLLMLKHLWQTLTVTMSSVYRQAWHTDL